MIADCEDWERAIAAWRVGRRLLLADLIASGEPVPAPYCEAVRFCILNPNPIKPASPKVQRLTDAVQDFDKRKKAGVPLKDAFRAVCEAWGYKESIMDNAGIKRTRPDVNAELRRRAELNLEKTC
ncbi:hypothetical protein [Bradyrhizobium sp. CCBAU 25338]|uniref:hypothetical protein n=1 Tax=Bradyrhizobium sp. CCBAU 25338 TaxID=1641877 RepID=UPI002304B6E8|nr:hypothetical protein [Bradyrhizobium sp. CCBAU 25338]MDA9532812.1 hypothetical protein [Bradyrhizobium sp. CCBAU 25338]